MKRIQKALELNNSITHKNSEGFLDLEKDKLAIAEFEKYVDENFGINLTGLEKIKWLINNDFYKPDLLEGYTDDQIKEVIDLVYSYDFKFQSFMAIKKFYDSYALKTNDKSKILERFEDRVISCALFLGKGNFDFTKKLATYMIQQKYQPATPTFSNAGKKRTGELISCFVLECDDSLNSINYIISTSMQLSKLGGGVAINLSRLRARGAPIKHVDSAASGVMPVIKILEDVFDYADQLGQRRGAGAAYLNIFHYDVVEFLDSKKINADEKSRIQTLSIGLIIPDKFIDLCIQGGSYYLFDPYSIFKKYQVHFSEINMTEWYDKLANDPDIRKKSVSARKMLNNISTTQFESGYPYMIYIDTANRKNPLKNLGKITMSNLCTEIFQIQEVSTINDYFDEDEIRRDICCNLGSINIASVFEQGSDLESVVDVAIRALSSVSDISKIVNAPGVLKANKELHSVGLGVMNFAGFLAKNHIAYDDPLAIEFADVLFSAINYYSILASSKIAEEKKESFLGFEKSDYASDEYWTKYLSKDYEPISPKIKQIFKDMSLPKKEDWMLLKSRVHKYGMYNSYRMAIAPTQTISYLQNATSSISPVVDLVEFRLYGNSFTAYPMPFLTKENWTYYKSAYSIDQKKIIDLVSVIQEHVDQGISTVLYVTNEYSTKDLVKLYIYAWKKGLKSLYYTRTKNLEVNECISCAV